MLRCISKALLSVMNLICRFTNSVMMVPCCPAGRVGWGILGGKILFSDILKFSPVEVEKTLGRTATLAGWCDLEAEVIKITGLMPRK